MLSLYLNKTNALDLKKKKRKKKKKKEKKKVTVVSPRFRSPLSPPLHFSTPRRSAHDLLSHTLRPHCWASRPQPHLQTWPPIRAALRDAALQPPSLPSRPLGISTIWSRFSTRLPLTLGSPPRVSPPSLLQTSLPFPSGNKGSYPTMHLPSVKRPHRDGP